MMIIAIMRIATIIILLTNIVAAMKNQIFNHDAEYSDDFDNDEHNSHNDDFDRDNDTDHNDHNDH